jgi:hypothetical protein
MEFVDHHNNRLFSQQGYNLYSDGISLNSSKENQVRYIMPFSMARTELS